MTLRGKIIPVVYTGIILIQKESLPTQSTS